MLVLVYCFQKLHFQGTEPRYDGQCLPSRETGLWAHRWRIILIVLTEVVKPARCRWPYFLARILDWISAAERDSWVNACVFLSVSASWWWMWRVTRCFKVLLSRLPCRGGLYPGNGSQNQLFLPSAAFVFLFSQHESANQDDRDSAPTSVELMLPAAKQHQAMAFLTHDFLLLAAGKPWQAALAACQQRESSDCSLTVTKYVSIFMAGMASWHSQWVAYIAFRQCTTSLCVFPNPRYICWKKESSLRVRLSDTVASHAWGSWFHPSTPSSGRSTEAVSCPHQPCLNSLLIQVQSLWSPLLVTPVSYGSAQIVWLRVPHTWGLDIGTKCLLPGTGVVASPARLVCFPRA